MCNEDRAWNGNFLPNKLKLILKSNDMIYDFWRFNKLHSVSTTMWSVVFKCKTINFNNIITLQKLLDADSFLYSFIYIDKLLFFSSFKWPENWCCTFSHRTTAREEKKMKINILFLTLKCLGVISCVCFFFFLLPFGMQNYCRHVIFRCGKLSTISRCDRHG